MAGKPKIKLKTAPAKPVDTPAGKPKIKLKTPPAPVATSKAPGLLAKAGKAIAKGAKIGGAIGLGVNVMGALANSKVSPRGTGGPKAEEARKAKADSAKTYTKGPDTRPTKDVKAPTPKARPVAAKKKNASDSTDKMDLNKLVLKGVKAKQMNKMTKKGLENVYKRVVKD